MEDLRALSIGIIGGLIVIALSRTYTSYRKKSIQDDISLLEFEKTHLKEMKGSSFEMNRSSFRAIFALLMFMGLANLVPKLLLLIDPEKFSTISDYFTLTIWAIFVGLAIRFWKRYEHLKNYSAFVNKIDSKLTKLKNKLENS